MMRISRRPKLSELDKRLLNLLILNKGEARMSEVSKKLSIRYEDFLEYCTLGVTLIYEIETRWGTINITHDPIIKITRRRV